MFKQLPKDLNSSQTWEHWEQKTTSTCYTLNWKETLNILLGINTWIWFKKNQLY